MSLANRINKLVNTKDFCSAFLDAMDQAIKNQNPPRVVKPNIKPSKISCLRQMYYILINQPVDSKETVDPNMVLIQKDGSYMHLVIQKILSDAAKQGIVFLDPVQEVVKAQQLGSKVVVRPSEHDDNPYEVTCYDEELGTSFKFDGVVLFQNKKPILEIKNEDQFKWIKRIGPDPDHIDQVTLYSIALLNDLVLFIYVGRNYKARKAYLVQITEDMKNQQRKRIKIAKRCAEVRIVPAKSKDPKKCKYCSYKHQCKKDGEATHEGKINEMS